MTDITAIGPVGYSHLLLFCLLIPWAAIRTARRLAANLYPPRRKFFLAVLVQQIVFISISAGVAWYEGIELFKPPQHPVQSFAVSAVFLAFMIVLMYPQWRRNVANRERKIYLFMPRDRTEKSLWVLLSAAAGIGEEITYRGVVWVLLARLTGSLWLAALLTSIVFAVSHFMQGWKSISAILGLALSFHLLVWLTGSLIPGMFVHFLYDLTAGMMYSHFGEKLGYPLEGIPVDRELRIAD